MFDLDHWREIAVSLMANKLRTLLTAFGVAWGMFMLVVLLGSGNGLRNGIERDFAGQAKNSFYVWTRRTTLPYRGFPRGRGFWLQLEDIAALRASLPELDIIAPRSQMGGFGSNFNVVRGAKSGSFGLMADVPELVEVLNRKMVAGRFLNPLDLAESRKVCVIGSRVVETLFAPGEEAVGEWLTIGGSDYLVVGRFEPQTAGSQGDRDARAIHVPMTTYQRAFGTGSAIGWLAITTREGHSAAAAEARCLEVLKRRHQVHPEDDRAFGHWNTEEEYQKIQGLFTGIRWLVWVVGIGTLTAGVIGIGNIMLVIVRERTHEIGIRRAIGATPWSVMRQVMLEALLLTGVAGYLGLFAGVVALELTSSTLAAGDGMFSRPGVSFVTTLQALGILVMAGLIAGLLPAQRAVAVSPVNALRTDT